jgi:hypothetical protein
MGRRAIGLARATSRSRRTLRDYTQDLVSLDLLGSLGDASHLGLTPYLVLANPVDFFPRAIAHSNGRYKLMDLLGCVVDHSIKAKPTRTSLLVPNFSYNERKGPSLHTAT